MKIGNNNDIQQLRQQEAAIQGEYNAAQQEQSSTETLRSSENAQIDVQISENDSSLQGANDNLTSSQSSQASAQANADDASAAESAASSQKSQMDANLTTADGAVADAGNTYSAAQTQQSTAQSAFDLASGAVSTQQGIVSNCESDVSSAQGELSKAQSEQNSNKNIFQQAWDGIKSAVSSAIDFFKSALDKVVNLLNTAKEKLQEFLRTKVDKENALKYTKGVSEQAKSKLETKKQERDKAKELVDATQTILDAKTGAREVSEAELAAAIDIVVNAQAEKAELDAKAGELNTQKTQIQEKYDTLLASISDAVNGKQVALEDIQAQIAALEAEADKASQEIAVESELDMQLASLGSDLMAQNDTQGIGGDVASFFGGGVKGKENDFLEKQALLEEAIESGDFAKLEAAYKSIMGKDLTPEELQNSKEAAEVASMFANGELADSEGNPITQDVLNAQLKEQANVLMNELEENVNGQGWLGKSISFTNNFLDLGTSENEAKAKVAEYRKLIGKLDTCSDPNEYAALYKAITGESLNFNSAGGLLSGESKVANSFAAESVLDYDATQNAGKDIVCGVGTALAVTAAVAAAPFTGGASLLLAAGVGGATMTTLKATDGLTSRDGYSFEQGVRDFGTGALEGVLVPLTGGIAKGVGNALMKEAGKSLLKTTLVNAAAGSVAGATFGGVYSGGSYIINTAGKTKMVYDEATGEMKEVSALSFEEFGKTTLTGTAAGAFGGGFGGAASSLVRPLLTSGSSAASQITGRLISGGISGLSGGTAGGFAAGSTSYLLNTDGEEMNFEDWLNTSLNSATTGALTGTFSGVVFEAVNIAAGAPKPEGTAKVETENLENGAKIKNYYDKNGNLIAQDARASDLLKIMNENASGNVQNNTALSTDVAGDLQNLTSRTIRMSYSYLEPQTITAPNGTEYFVEGGYKTVQNYDWGGNFNNLRTTGFINVTQQPDSIVLNEQPQTFISGGNQQNTPLLLQNTQNQSLVPLTMQNMQPFGTNLELPLDFVPASADVAAASMSPSVSAGTTAGQVAGVAGNAGASAASAGNAANVGAANAGNVGIANYSTANPGTRLPKNEWAYVSPNTVLKLGNTDLDLSQYTNAMKDGQVVWVGRDINNNIPIPNDTSVSRSHLAFQKYGSGLIVMDISTNGTTISAKPAANNTPAPAPNPSPSQPNVSNSYVLINADKAYRVTGDFSVTVGNGEKLNYSYSGLQKSLKNGESIVMGRANINPNDTKISGKHFEIYKKDNELFVMDTGSLNGTKVRGGVDVQDSLNITKAEAQAYIQDQVARGNLPASVATYVNDLSGIKLEGKLMQDIALAKYAEQNNIPLIDAYVPNLDYLPNLRTLPQTVKAGDAYEFGKHLYMTPDGKTSVPLDITKQQYFELFPPIQRFANSQGSIGDCYLVSDLQNYYNNPLTRTRLLQNFSREGDNIAVRLHQPNVKACYDINSFTSSGELLTGAKGFQMLEKTYGLQLHYKNKNNYIAYMQDQISHTRDQNTKNQLLSQLNNFMAESSQPNYNKVFIIDPVSGNKMLVDTQTAARIEGQTNRSVKAYGTAEEYLRGNGGWSVDSTRSLLNVESKRVLVSDWRKIETELKKIEGNPDYSLWAATIPKQGATGESELTKFIYSTHAYRIMPLSDGTIDIINPWNSTNKMNIPRSAFMQYFSYIEIPDYDKIKGTY